MVEVVCLNALEPYALPVCQCVNATLLVGCLQTACHVVYQCSRACPLLLPFPPPLPPLHHALQCGDVSEVFNRPPPTLEPKPSPSPSDEWVVSVDMKSALHQVKTFCGDRLSGIERRRYEEQRAKELGGKVGLPYMEVKSSEGDIDIGMLGRLTDIYL